MIETKRVFAEVEAVDLQLLRSSRIREVFSVRLRDEKRITLF
jgi:hypothetical protein